MAKPKLDCKRGHPISGDNVYISPKGTRQCKKCKRESRVRYKNTMKGKITRKRVALRALFWTLERFETLLKTQRNACAICKIPFREPPIADHDHGARIPREVLCRTCNLGLGMFKDNPLLLELAAEYLRKYGK